MIWQGFTRAHTPLIEGLRHGGQAQHMRRALTAFGSGWRGIVSLPPSLIRDFTNMGSVSGASVSSDYARSFVSFLESKKTPFYRRAQVSGAIEKLNQAASWSDKTGFDAVIVSQNTNRSQLRQLIRHERIHSLEDRFPNHPFIRSEIDAAPDLEQSIRGFLNNPDKAKEAYNYYSSRDATTQASEKLAWGRQADASFFQRARSAGLKAPQTAAADAKTIMRAGEHVHETSSLRRIFSKAMSSLRMSRGL